MCRTPLGDPDPVILMHDEDGGTSISALAVPPASTPSTAVSALSLDQAKAAQPRGGAVSAAADSIGVHLFPGRPGGRLRGPLHGGDPRLHLARQVRHDAEQPLDQHELPAVVHLVLLGAHQHLKPGLAGRRHALRGTHALA